MGDNLNNDIELIRSFSICESLENLRLQNQGHEAGIRENKNEKETKGKYVNYFPETLDLEDDFFTAEAEVVDPPVESSTDMPESHNSGLCRQKIESLEQQVQLLKAQNAQLVVNSCVMYNTLMQHIQKLRAELMENTAIIPDQCP